MAEVTSGRSNISNDKYESEVTPEIKIKRQESGPIGSNWGPIGCEQLERLNIAFIYGPGR